MNENFEIKSNKEWECSVGHKWIGSPFLFTVNYTPEYVSKRMCPYCVVIAMEELVTSNVTEISEINLKEN